MDSSLMATLTVSSAHTLHGNASSPWPARPLLTLLPGPGKLSLRGARPSCLGWRGLA